MCGGSLWNIVAVSTAIQEASRTLELTENLALALLETRWEVSSEKRAEKICAKLNSLDRILLQRALVETARYESVQIRATKIIEILKKGRSPVLTIKIIDPSRP